jgi:HNH endonuclease
VPGLGHASSEEIAVECGKPERVAVSNEELRRHMPTAADLAEPTFEPTRLSCVADGSLVVEAHPVWLQNAIAGGGFRVRRGGDTIVRGAIAREEEFECGALAVEVDHVVERERGGRDDAENLRSLCEVATPSDTGARSRATVASIVSRSGEVIADRASGDSCPASSVQGREQVWARTSLVVTKRVTEPPSPRLQLPASTPKGADLQGTLVVGRAGFEPATLGLKVPCSAS